MKTPELAIFARQPDAGWVTRLAPQAGAERAAEIATAVLRATVELAVSYWPGEVCLAGEPDARHPLFQALAGEFHIRLIDQAAGERGERMHAVLRDGIARHGAAAILTADVPHCPPAVLEEGFELLARGKNILGPAEDGGYYLIGLQNPDASLFRGLAWGSRSVLDNTLARAERAGRPFELLPRLRDIDSWQDLVAVAGDFAPLGRFIPQTARTDFARRPRTPA